MADIFISYARPDRPRVEKLAAALEAEGYSVWWDRHIEGGAAFARAIEDELDNAHVVIVAWSKESVKSDWVKDEAGAARDAEKLIPISIDETTPPLGFKQYHAIDFDTWRGDEGHKGYQDLIQTVEKRIKRAQDLPELTVGSQKASWAERIPKPALISAIALAIAAPLIALFLRSMEFSTQVGAASSAVEPSQASAAAADASALQTDDASMAVLAFADLSPEGDQEYFSDGIAEEILNVLARVDGLRVASRTSAFALKDRPDLNVAAIGDALDVRYVLEGSVRKAGETVRVTAQLIDSMDDRHLYSETFDRRLTAENLFAIQDEIARSIVDTLGERDVIIGVERESVRVAAGTNDLRAYELFLEGHDIFIRREFPKFPRMIEAFKQAVSRDPNFARAHAGLAGAYAIQPGWGFTDRDYYALAGAAARRALEIDPSLAFAYAILSDSACGGIDGCTEETDLLNKAIDLDPRDATIANWRGQHLLTLGYFDRAIADFERCLELDPAYVNCRSHYAMGLAFLGRIDEALYQARLLKNAEAAGLHLLYIAAELLVEGRYGEAAEITRASMQPLMPAGLTEADASRIVQGFVSLRDPDADYEGLWRDDVVAFMEPGADPATNLPPDMFYFYRRFDEIQSIPGGPFYWLRMHADYLQSPQRYDFMERMQLPDYWRERGFPPRCRAIDLPADGRDYICD